MKTVTLTVEGLSCSHCVKALRSALASINVKGKVNLEDKTVEVDLNNNEVELSAIKEAIENKGFKIQ